MMRLPLFLILLFVVEAIPVTQRGLIIQSFQHFAAVISAPT